MNSGLFGFWRRFGSVTGFFKPVPLPKPRQKPKILAAHRYIFSVNALSALYEGVLKWSFHRPSGGALDLRRIPRAEKAAIPETKVSAKCLIPAGAFLRYSFALTKLCRGAL
jgi:hypothetical protein